MRRLLPLALLGGCAMPDMNAAFTQFEAVVVDDEEAAGDAFVAVVQRAERTLDVAVPHLTDGFLTDAIIERFEAGVDVRVASDIDQASDSGIRALQEAGVPLRLGDGGITYFDFALNQDVAWSSEQVIMSHAFAIADQLHVVNATAVGGSSPARQIVLNMRGEDLAWDMGLEHTQVFGGSDATALTAFSAPAKSIADARWHYPTESDAPVELWFGPQERVTKRVIDAVYTARKSVRVMSNELVNEGMALALQEKARWGFRVEAIVGPEFGTTSQPLARLVTNGTPDVDKRRFTDAPDLPTLILIDIEGGVDTAPRAFVLSHDLYSAARLFRNAEVVTDQLIDGNLFVITDVDYRVDDDPGSVLQPLVDTWFDHLDRSGGF